MISSMSDIAARLADLRASTSALLEGLSTEQWADADVRAPSVLPGWTRGHVVTHIARNADGISATLAGALRGEIVARYPNGWAGRAADIEAGSGRSAIELVADVRESAERLDHLYGAVADAAGWDLVTENDRPARSWLNARWREVEIHRADLGGSYGAADWPAGFVGYLLPRLAREVGPRCRDAVRIEAMPVGSTSDFAGTVWASGSGDPVVVRGPDWALLAWLAGRPSLAGSALSEQPELTPWS